MDTNNNHPEELVNDVNSEQEDIYLNNAPRVLFENIPDEVYEKVLKEGENDEFLHEMVEQFFSDPQVENEP